LLPRRLPRNGSLDPALRDPGRPARNTRSGSSHLEQSASCARRSRADAGCKMIILARWAAPVHLAAAQIVLRREQFLAEPAHLSEAPPSKNKRPGQQPPSATRKFHRPAPNSPGIIPSIRTVQLLRDSGPTGFAARLRRAGCAGLRVSIHKDSASPRGRRRAAIPGASNLVSPARTHDLRARRRAMSVVQSVELLSQTVTSVSIPRRERRQPCFTAEASAPAAAPH